MNFYILKETNYKTDKDFADTECLRAGGMSSLGKGAPVCPQCGKFVGGMIWIPPYKIELVMYTNQFGNVIDKGEELVVDEYFKSCFEKTDLTGIEFLGEAEITKFTCRWKAKKRQLGTPPQYYVARIKYGCAAIDHNKSGSVFDDGCEPTCDYCRTGIIRRYPRIVIDESTWDGTDIFLARGKGSTITTSQRFKDWWDSCNFNNCKVVPSEEFRRDHG